MTPDVLGAIGRTPLVALRRVVPAGSARVVGKVIAGLGAAALVAVAAAIYSTRPDAPFDRSFDTSVGDPTYRDNGPVVLFDEGHHNAHTTKTGYRPLADLLRNDGYVVRVASDSLSAASLDGAAVLVVAVAQGANDTGDEAAYSDAEAAAVAEWVRAGGSVLLITDHWPFGLAMSSLAARLGIGLGGGFVQDPVHHEPARGDSHLIFSLDNGLLHDHPIVRGRNPTELVQRVLTFTGSSAEGPAGATAFLALSDAATERPPGPARAIRDGGDVRVEMEYGDPTTAAGRAQGIAFESGAGRVVALAEAGMLRAQRGRTAGLVGMNVPGYDNRQLALNIVHWLSRGL